jgi:universal stress protein F
MYKNILVATALDHAHDIAAAFDIARALAAEGASLTALHVLEDIPAYAAQYVPAEQAGTRHAEAEAQLKADLGGVANVKPVVVSGHPGSTIVEYADRSRHRLHHHRLPPPRPAGLFPRLHRRPRRPPRQMRGACHQVSEGGGLAPLRLVLPASRNSFGQL